VHFVTGTDEHGLKVQRAAQARGADVLAHCDTMSAKFRQLFEVFNIEYVTPSASE